LPRFVVTEFEEYARCGLLEVAAELQSFGRLLADDALHTSETVLIAGQHALDTVRSIGESNPKYGPFVTATFDALRALTKAALAEGARLRAELAAQKAQAAAEAALAAQASEKAAGGSGGDKAGGGDQSPATPKTA